jgi:hypothetical protein
MRQVLRAICKLPHKRLILSHETGLTLNRVLSSKTEEDFIAQIILIILTNMQ